MSPCQFLGAHLCLSARLSVGLWVRTCVCLCGHIDLCAPGVGEHTVCPPCSGCLHGGVWICGSTWQGDDPFCRLVWPTSLGLAWPLSMLFPSFSGPLCPPAQSVEGTLKTSRGVVSGICWEDLPASLLPASPKRLGLTYQQGREAGRPGLLE